MSREGFGAWAPCRGKAQKFSNVGVSHKTMLDKNGFELVRKPVGEYDIAKKVNSYRDDTLIYKRIRFEGADALIPVSQNDGSFYGDVTGLPSNPSEVPGLLKSAKANADRVELALKSKFGDKDFRNMTIADLSALFSKASEVSKEVKPDGKE